MEHKRPSTAQRSTDSPPQRSGGGHPIALCQHEVPGAPTHIDLFIGPAGPFGDDDRVLDGWRLPKSPLSLPPEGSMPIEPLGAHRGRYVRLPHPVTLSEGRGTVIPLAIGEAQSIERSATTWRLHAHWTDGSATTFSLSASMDGSGDQLTVHEQFQTT